MHYIETFAEAHCLRYLHFLDGRLGGCVFIYRACLWTQRVFPIARISICTTICFDVLFGIFDFFFVRTLFHIGVNFGGYGLDYGHL